MTIICSIIKYIGKIGLVLAFAMLKLVSFSFKAVGCLFLFTFHIFLMLVDMGTPS